MLFRSFIGLGRRSDTDIETAQGINLVIFPEIEYDMVDALRGLNISITTTAKTDEECKALLAAFRFPFKN